MIKQTVAHLTFHLEYTAGVMIHLHNQHVNDELGN